MFSIQSFCVYVKEHSQYLGQTLVSYSLATTDIASINGSAKVAADNLWLSNLLCNKADYLKMRIT